MQKSLRKALLVKTKFGAQGDSDEAFVRARAGQRGSRY